MAKRKKKCKTCKGEGWIAPVGPPAYPCSECAPEPKLCYCGNNYKDQCLKCEAPGGRYYDEAQAKKLRDALEKAPQLSIPLDLCARYPGFNEYLIWYSTTRFDALK